jgi:hypothetical protein
MGWKNGIKLGIGTEVFVTVPKGSENAFIKELEETRIEFNLRMDRAMDKILSDAGLEIPDPWEGFDIPEHRKDIDNPSNAGWVLRNLAIRNGNHPRLSDILNLAKEIVRGED